MNIFGVGGAELVLIFVIMLIVAGPKRMIRWAYVAGQYVAKLRRMWEEVVDVMQKEVDAAGLDIQIPKDLPSKASVTKLVTSAVKPYTDPIEGSLKAIQKPLKETLDETKAAVKTNQKLDIASEDTPDLGAWSQNSAGESFGAWTEPKHAGKPEEKEA